MARTLNITCLKTGGGAYLVDGGRAGHRALGVPSGGPADGVSMRAANHLQQQAADTPCLELTLTGGRWLLAGQGQICLTGVDMNWHLNDQPIATHTVITISGDALLTGGSAHNGLRAYLSARGSWELPRRLGSAESGVPGIPSISPGWMATINGTSPISFSTNTDVFRVRVVEVFELAVHPGPEWSLLNGRQQGGLLSEVYRVSRDSNRQGIRLEAKLVTDIQLPSLISSPVLPGTIQLTPGGPVLLGPDAQTIGGYPRVLLVTDGMMMAAAFQLPLGGKLRLVLV